MKLGKRPVRRDRLNRTLKYGSYFDAAKLPGIPIESDFPNAAPLGMLLNDELGNCVMAARLHMRMIWLKSKGSIYVPTDKEALTDYERVGDYIPGDDSTDNGCDMLTSLTDWKNVGIGSAKSKILAFAEVDHTNEDMMRHASYWFGGLFIGIAMPAAAQNMNNTHDGWVDPPATLEGIWQPNSWGGHCIGGAGMGRKHIDTMTWGERIPMQLGYAGAYVDECYAVWSEEFLPADATIDGFAAKDLLSDVSNISA